MTLHAIPADEKLTLQVDPITWQLIGPDDLPVLEVRARTIFYHPLFGQWRDLPPGDRISGQGVESVQVRWDGGWAVGVTLAPGGVWRRLVRWADSREIATADDAARALSQLLGCPLRSEESAAPAIVRVGYAHSRTDLLVEPASPPAVAPEEEPAFRPSVDAPPPVEELIPEVKLQTATPPVPVPQVYNVEDASDVRLPLRLGGGAQLRMEHEDRLVLDLPTGARGPSTAIGLLGLLAVLGVAFVVWAVRSGVLPDPVLGLVMGGGLLIVIGVVGVLLLARLDRQLRRQVIFDRAEGTVTIIPAEANKPVETIPVSALHGVRLRGAVLRKRYLVYQRSVSLIGDKGDTQVFVETRETQLPPDPAVMPSLPAVRRQADEQAGPSLARAGARVIAWFLRMPLADE